MKIDINHYLVIAFCVFFVSFSSTTVQDKELKQKADTHFKDKEYLKALPLYSQLLSLKPTDVELNFKYGACLIFDEGDTEEPIKYLKYAVENNASVEANYFLGKAYHLNYQFNDAIDAYSKFLSEGDNKIKGKYKDTQRQIEMCAFGSNLLNNIKEIFVLDKVKTADIEFFRNYDLTDVGGRILVTPDELLSANDKRYKHRSLIHFPGESSKIYFASYGKDDHTDIYTSTIMADGSFSKPVKVGGAVNTKYNEDYPFLHPDGQTLYFASKGHNSMGGYDIFKSQLSGMDQFNNPINLDFAINSPDDDIFYIADANNKLAYFASGRSSGAGDIHVYRVMVESRPLNMAVIKGQFESQISADLYDASVYVQDATTNNEIGKFYTNKETGEYIIVLPKAGRYKFFVEAPDSKYTHSGMVEIPPSQQIRAFKQTMDLVEVNEKEKLIIKNLFEETVDEDVMALVQQVIKQRAELNINVDESNLDELAINDFGTVFEQAGFEQNTTKEQVVQALTSKEYELEEMVNEQADISQKSKNLSLNKKLDAENSLVKAEEYYGKMKLTTDQLEKEKLLIQAAKQKGKSLELADEAIVAMGLCEFMNEEKNKNEVVLRGFKQDNQKLFEAIDIEDAKTLEMLKDQKKFMDETAIDTPENQLAKEAAEERRSSQKILSRATDLSDELTVLERRLEGKMKSLEKTKKEKDRIQIGNEIQVLEDEIELVEKDKNRAFEELAEKQRNANILEGSQDLVQNIEEGEVEVRGDVYVSTDQLDKDLAEIIKRNDNIEISEVEIQEILINRPALVNQFFTNERELTAFKSTFHLPEYISLEDTSTEIAENSSNVVSVEEYSISEPQISEEEINPEELALTTELVEFDVAQQVIYPDIDEEINDIIFSDVSSAEKSTKITQVRDQFDESVEDARQNLFNLRDKGEINDEVFEKNNDFLEELGSSKVNEINKIIAAYEPRVREEIALNENSANTTHDIYNTAGVSKEEIELKKRLAEINNSSHNPQEVVERATAARQEYIDILNNKIEQNNINLKYAPSEEMETQINSENEALQNIIDLKTKEIERDQSFLADDSRDPNFDQSNLNDFSEYSLDLDTEDTVVDSDVKQEELDSQSVQNEETDLTSIESASPDVVENMTAENALNEAKSDTYFADYSRLSMSPREYKSSSAKESFPDQEILYREAKELMEIDVNAAVEKEIVIMEKAEASNNHELDHLIQLAENSGFMAGNLDIINAKNDFASAKALRDTAKVINDNDEKLYILKHAYGYESKGLEFLEASIAAGSEDIVSDNLVNSIESGIIDSSEEIAEDNEEAFFESQAEVFSIETNDKMGDNELDILTDPSKKGIEEILSNELGLSEEEVMEVKDNDERLSDLLKDWKIIQIDQEIATQRKYIATYDEQRDIKSQSYEDLQLALSETTNPREKERYEQTSKDLLAEADVLDYYINVALENIDQLEIKRNDVINGELDFAIMNEEEQYVELSDFVNRYFEGDNPFDLLNIEEDVESDVAQVNTNSENVIDGPKTSESASEDADITIGQIESGELSQNTGENVVQNTVSENILEYEEGVDRDTKLIIVDGSDYVYEYKSGDIRGLENKLTSEPFNPNEYDVPQALEDEVYFLSEEDVVAYESVPEGIPLNADLPEGLIFQVQIGAYYRPVPADVFKGFAPINGERSKTGLIRYRAGMFKIFDTANKAKNEIRAKGYSDAFVVAFYNGERIPLHIGRSMLEAQTIEKYNYALETDSKTPSEEPKETVDMNQEFAPVTPVQEVRGMFYTVQVGVYSREVSAEDLFHVTPLTSELTSNNKIRYTSGIFNDFNKANEWKAEVQKLGISDAFVSAYNEGKRISLRQARSFKPALKVEPEPEVKRTPVIQNDEVSEINPIEDMSEDDLWYAFDKKMTEEDRNVMYKLRFGPYANEIPMEEANVIIDFKDEITFSNDQSGAFMYTTNEPMPFADAVELKDHIDGPFIVNLHLIAIVDQEEIDHHSAKSLLEN